MKLATIEEITKVEKHPNADLLDIVTVLNYQCVVLRDTFKRDDKIVFIYPDSVLPDAPWSALFKAKSNRVKAIKLRDIWSEGIVLGFNEFKGDGVFCVPASFFEECKEGDEVSNILGITKYDPILPDEAYSKGFLPYGIPPTDEERWNSIRDIPWGTLVDVTLKRDGTSFTAYACKERTDLWQIGICGRRLEYKLEGQNKYLEFKPVLDLLLPYCQEHDVSIALRGELTGAGIQSFSKNPHAVGPKKLHFFSSYLIDTHEYARIDHPLYYRNICTTLNLNMVELLETRVPLTKELVKKYSEDITTIDGKPFEGIICTWNTGSCKVVNKAYDSKK